MPIIGGHIEKKLDKNFKYKVIYHQEEKPEITSSKFFYTIRHARNWIMENGHNFVITELSTISGSQLPIYVKP